MTDDDLVIFGFVHVLARISQLWEGEERATAGFVVTVRFVPLLLKDSFVP